MLGLANEFEPADNVNMKFWYVSKSKVKFVPVNVLGNCALVNVFCADAEKGVTKARFPEPSVFKTWFALPSAVGWLNPSNITLPEPLGVIAILPFDALTIEFPFTSKEPPNCGLVSVTISNAESDTLTVLADVLNVANVISSEPS